MKEENKFPVPRWLEELQQKSWEPEILLSGIVLYGMFKVPALLDAFLTYFKLNIFSDSQDIDNLVSLFKMGIYWLITGLILHLICRGIWIGMVGLSYTFPNGIRMDRVNYEGRFKEKLDRTASFEMIVMRLEKICSSLFSVSFMLFMSLIGGYLFFFVLIVLPFYLSYVYLDMGFSGPLFDAFQVYVVVVVGIAMVALGDFLSLGYLRRFKWFAKLFWPIHRIISALTLSRFYRPIYYGMVTNFNKWAFSALLVAFVMLSIVGAGMNNASFYSGDAISQLELWENANGYSVFSGYYQDQNSDGPSIRAHIPSDIINGDVLRFFMVANVQQENRMLKHTSLDSLMEIYPDTSRVAMQMMVVHEYFTVFLDKEKVENPKWLFHYDTQNEQRGYLTYLDISHLQEGLHEVDIREPEGNPKRLLVEIPFYRDITLSASSPPQNGQMPEEDSADFQPKPFGIRD